MSLKVLVIGGTGLVGNTLVRFWKRRDAEVIATSTRYAAGPALRLLDMRQPDVVTSLIKEVSPMVVAMPGSSPHVDYCELHPQETAAVNVEGSLNVARSCRAFGIPTIFFSSDYVFDGSKDFYVEQDPVSPINEYGRQKVQVESELLSLSPKNLIIRTSGIYGWEWRRKNFVLQICAKLRAGEPMKVADDLIYCPTYVENLAEITIGLCSRGEGGVYHVAGADATSRFDFAKQVARTFHLNESLIEPVPSSLFKSPTRRPKKSALDTGRVRALGFEVCGSKRGLEHMAASETQWGNEAAQLFPPFQQ